MSDSTFLIVAIFVFVMMMIGLALTMWEFRHGQPRREHEDPIKPAGEAPPTRAEIVADRT